MTDKEQLEKTLKHFNDFQNQVQKERKWDIKMDVRKITSPEIHDAQGKRVRSKERSAELRIHNDGIVMYKDSIGSHDMRMLYKRAVCKFMNYAMVWMFYHAKDRAKDFKI